MAEPGGKGKEKGCEGEAHDRKKSSLISRITEKEKREEAPGVKQRRKPGLITRAQDRGKKRT